MRLVAAGSILLAGAIALLGGAMAPPVVHGAETVRANVFFGAQILPLMVASEKGFFNRYNIKLELSFTRSSQEQMTGVRDGKWDVGSTGIDNVIAYNLNEGADFFMFMGVGGTTIHFFVDPSLASFEDLRGKPLGVDALTTGYAFILQKILHENGLRPGDYRLIPVGETGARLEAMKKREILGALLTPPFIVQARNAGFRDMGEVTKYIPNYVPNAAFTTRRWAAAHGDTLVRYIKANIEAADWIYDPKNGGEAISIWAKALKVPLEVAARSFTDDIMHPQMGLARKAALPVEGIKTVIALRAEMGHLKPPLPDPGQFYDLSYYEKAAR